MKTLIAIILVMAIALGIFALTSGKKAEAPQNTPTQQNQDNKNLNGQGSLQSLLDMERDLTCTFERVDDASNTRGKLFVSGNNLRGDFIMTGEGADEIASHMIRKDDMLYVWTGAQGTKFTETNTEEIGAQQSVNLDDSVTYDCSSWSKDISKFDLPNNVTFVELSNLLNTRADTQINVDCTACDQIPAGVARDQCRVALGC